MYVDLKLKKIGGSLGAIIPKEAVRKEDLHENDVVSVQIQKKKGRIRTIEELFGAFHFDKPAQEIKDEMREGWGD